MKLPRDVDRTRLEVSSNLLPPRSDVSPPSIHRSLKKPEKMFSCGLKNDLRNQNTAVLGKAARHLSQAE